MPQNIILVDETFNLEMNNPNILRFDKLGDNMYTLKVEVSYF